MKLSLRPLKALGEGPGAAKTPGAVLPAFKKPAAPYKGFVQYDPGLAAQRQRGAMKATFGKRLRVTDQQLKEAAAVTGGLATGTGLAATAYELHEHVKVQRRHGKTTLVRKGLTDSPTTREDSIRAHL